MLQKLWLKIVFYPSIIENKLFERRNSDQPIQCDIEQGAARQCKTDIWNKMIIEAIRLDQFMIPCAEILSLS